MNTWDHTVHVDIGVSAGEKGGDLSSRFLDGDSHAFVPYSLQINEEPSYS